MSMVIPVILSGGSGSRLWPLSRSKFPKQFWNLLNKETLIQETAQRFRSHKNYGDITVICNEEHRFLISDQLRAIDVNPKNIILEPQGKNTAAAVAITCLSHSPEDIILIVPSDHFIEDTAQFHHLVSKAIPIVAAGKIVTFGAVADFPSTAYGYIQKGQEAFGTTGIYTIQQFVEKPNKKIAEKYLSTKAYLWNCGLYMFKASTMLEEFRNLQPEILALCKRSLSNASREANFLRLEEKSFLNLPSLSIDHAITEKTKEGVVIEANMGWCDLGCWEELWKISSKDNNENTLVGDVLVKDVRRSYIRSENQLISVLGLDDIIVVADGDAVLVANKSYSQDVRDIVKTLKDENRTEHESHKGIVYRPWGQYQSIDSGDGFQVKKITVNPHGKLSLQLHHHREEHWVIIQGTAKVTRDDQELIMYKGDTIHLPQGIIHRVENTGDTPLQFIEVQLGDYLGEDDIVRLEDMYGRVENKRVI